MKKICQERVFGDPKLLERYLALLHLVGRRIVGVDIDDWYEGRDVFGPVKKTSKTARKKRSIFCEADFTAPFLIHFEDGASIELTARNDMFHMITFSVDSELSDRLPIRVTSTDAAYSETLGHRIVSVDVRKKRSSQDSLGNWVNPKTHDESELIDWIAFRMDNGFTIKTGAWIDFALYELEGPDGKTVSKKLSDGHQEAMAFRRSYVQSIRRASRKGQVSDVAPDMDARRVNAAILSSPTSRTFRNPASLQKALAGCRLEGRRIAGFWLGSYWGDLDFGSAPMPAVTKPMKKANKPRSVLFEADAGLSVRFDDGAELFLNSFDEPRIQFRFRTRPSKSFNSGKDETPVNVRPEDAFFSLALGKKVHSVVVEGKRSKTYSWGQQIDSRGRYYDMIVRVDIKLHGGTKLRFEPIGMSQIAYSIVDRNGRVLEQVPSDAFRLAEAHHRRTS